MINQKKILKKSVKNLFYSFLGNIFLIIFQMFIVGYNIKTLGEERAGFYFFLQTIFFVGSSIIGLGLNTSVIREISIHLKSKNLKKIRNILNSVWFVNILMAFISFVAIYYLKTNIIEWTKIKSIYTNDAYFCLLFLNISFLINSSFNFFRSVFSAYQEYKYLSFYNILNTVFINLGMLYVLIKYPYLKYIGLVNLIASILSAIVLYLFAYKLTKLKIIPIINIKEIKNLFDFSLKVFITRQGYTLRDNIDRWIINSLKGSACLPGYILGQKLALRIQLFFVNVTHFIYPLISEISSDDDLKGKTYNIYNFSQWFVSLIGIILFVIILIYSNTILKYWVNESFAKNYLNLFLIATLQGAITMLCVIPSYVSYGLNKPNMNMYISLIQGLIILIFSYLIIKEFGLFGAALLQLFNYIIIYFFQSYYMAKKIFNIPIINILKNQSAPLLSILLLIFLLLIKINNIIYISETNLLFIAFFMIILIIYITEKLLNYKNINFIFNIIKNI